MKGLIKNDWLTPQSKWEMTRIDFTFLFSQATENLAHYLFFNAWVLFFLSYYSLGHSLTVFCFPLLSFTDPGQNQNEFLSLKKKQLC